MKTFFLHRDHVGKDPSERESVVSLWALEEEEDRMEPMREMEERMRKRVGETIGKWETEEERERRLGSDEGSKEGSHPK